MKVYRPITLYFELTQEEDGTNTAHKVREYCEENNFKILGGIRRINEDPSEYCCDVIINGFYAVQA